MKPKHKHEFITSKNSGAGHFGVLLICKHCGKAFTYDADWVLYDLKTLGKV